MTAVQQCSEVIIAADNDRRGDGLDAAENTAERLSRLGLKVRIALPERAEDDGSRDWNDALVEASGDPDKLAALRSALLDAEVFERVESGMPDALEEGEFLALEFPPRELLLGPWLPRPGLVMVHAQRGEGKTYFVLAVGKAVASGSALMGWPCPAPARVLYVDGELPGAALQDRLRRFDRSPPGMFHVLSRDTYHLQQKSMPDLAEEAGRAELDRIIALIRPDLVIIDAISTLVRSGVENEAESWAPIQDWLMGHRWQGRTVVLVHHEGKSGKPRGTSKREDPLDTMIGLRKLPEESNDDASVFELTFSKSRDF